MLTSLLLAAETAKLGAAIGAGIAAVGAGHWYWSYRWSGYGCYGSSAREDW